MKKLIALIALCLSILAFGGGVTTASADDDCQKVNDPTCELFLQQQDAPAYNGPLADGGPVRCVWVTSNAPTALVLREGAGTNGDPITSWRKSALNWQQGRVGGHEAYVAQICFSRAIPFNYRTLTLCGEIGHSIWRKQHIAFLKENDVKRGDPACVGGDGWCGFRGL